MDYDISIYEYGIKEYILTFKNRDVTEKTYEILKEYFNLHYNSMYIFDIFADEEGYEIYIVCNEFHLNGIKEMLKEELNLNGDWI